MGKIRGTPRMRSHISVHRDTTKYFSNSFIFKPKIEKEGLPSDSPAGLGAGGLRFESGRPDHLLLYCQWTVPDTLAWRLNLGPIWLKIQVSPRFLLRSFDWSTYAIKHRRLNVSQKNHQPKLQVNHRDKKRVPAQVPAPAQAPVPVPDLNEERIS